MSIYSDSLIFGKDKTERVVSIEVQDGHAELFIEKDDGSIESQFIKNKYWLLAHEQLDKNFVRLKGNLHYKWGRQFETRDEFMKLRSIHRNKDIYSLWDAKEATLVNKGITYFKGMKPNEVSILSFDIETTGLHHNEESKLLLISNTYRSGDKLERKLFCYDEYENEGKMIEAWCDWVREKNPSVLLGHNIFSFDLPYINYIASQYGVTLNLGRDGSEIHFASHPSYFRIDGNRDQEYYKTKVYGREIIDTMFLSIRYDFGRKYESYGLKPIIKAEGLEKKDRVFYDASQIRFKYTDKNEWEKIKQYAMFDADDSLSLFDLMIPAYFYMTQSVPKCFQSMIESATGSQLNSFLVRSYLQEGHSIPKATEVEPFEGAISFGNPGIYKNVFKVDVNSLYPSTIIQYEVYDRAKDPNANFLTMVKYFTKERLKNKKLAKDTGNKYYSDLEQSQKIFINSSYGLCGATGLNFNSPKNAALITAKGREILQQGIQWAESKNFIVPNGDTDSIAFCKNDQSVITIQEQKDLLSDLNNLFPENITWADDGYYPAVLIFKAKNYVLYDGKKMKAKGSALKDSKREKAIKEFLNKVVDALLISNRDPKMIYLEYIREAMNVNDISRWTSKKTISSKVLESERTNEEKIRQAIEGTEYVEGDKVYVYFDLDGNLKLQERWKEDHDPLKLVKKIFDASKIFDDVLPEDTFVNLSLKRNKNLLDDYVRI